MKKRLRKKRRLGEFQELGFEVRLTLDSKLSEAAHGEFSDRLFSMLEAAGLCYGGSCGAALDGFITTLGRGTVSEAARKQVMSFIESDAAVTASEAGPLVDAWR